MLMMMVANDEVRQNQSHLFYLLMKYRLSIIDIYI